MDLEVSMKRRDELINFREAVSEATPEARGVFFYA